MFGRRSGAAVPRLPERPAPAPEPVAVHVEPLPCPERPRAEPPPAEAARGDDYYRTKGAIFGALIEAIDLTQLARLDPDAAREEIRDIVTDIIGLKGVVMSIASRRTCSRTSATTCSATGRSSRCSAATTSPTSW